jgi:hypothetical protein
MVDKRILTPEGKEQAEIWEELMMAFNGWQGVVGDSE